MGICCKVYTYATGEEESAEAQVDVVRLAGRFFRERWEREKQVFDVKTRTWRSLPSAHGEGRGDYESDSSYRIAAFLGEKN